MKFFRFKFFLFISVALIFGFTQFSCTVSGTSWDLDATGPVLETTFDLSQALGDDIINYQPDSAIFINFNDTVYTFNFDSIISIPDTNYLYSQNWPLPNFVIPGGIPLPPFPIIINLGIGDRVDLTAVRIKSGKIKIKLKSVIPRDMSIEFFSPCATLYGNPLIFTDNIPAALPNDTSYFEKIIDLSGYYVDLRGPNQNGYNILYFYITPTLDANSPSFPVAANQFLFSINNELIKIRPNYAEGTVKPSTEAVNTNILTIGLSKFIKGGLLDVDSFRLGVKLINTLGVDLRVKINQIRSINDLTGVQKYLTHPIIGNYINLQMAQNLYNELNPVQHYDYTVWFTPQNSNIDQLVENIPDRIRMNAELEINPLANMTANNNFLYTNHPPQIALFIKGPLKFSVNQLYFVDTLDNPVFDEVQLDRFLSGVFTLKAENKFPIGFSIQTFILNDAGIPIDSMFADNVVLPAPVNANYRVEQPLISYINIPFDEYKAQSIKTAKKLLIKAKFTSVPDFQLLQMYSDYYLKLKLLADIKYRVVL